MGHLEHLHQVARSAGAGMRAALRLLARPSPRPPDPRPRPPGHLLHLTRCTACGACAAACPTGCLELQAGTAGEGQRLLRFRVDLAACVSCHRCSQHCPERCLQPGSLPLPPACRPADLQQDLLLQPPGHGETA